MGVKDKRSALRSQEVGKNILQRDYSPKKANQEELTTLQRKIEREEVTAHSLNQEKEINVRILKATRQEEEECRLKSR